MIIRSDVSITFDRIEGTKFWWSSSIMPLLSAVSRYKTLNFFKNWDKFPLHRLAPLPEISRILLELFNRFKNSLTLELSGKCKLFNIFRYNSSAIFFMIEFVKKASSSLSSWILWKIVIYLHIYGIHLYLVFSHTKSVHFRK